MMSIGRRRLLSVLVLFFACAKFDATFASNAPHLSREVPRRNSSTMNTRKNTRLVQRRTQSEDRPLPKDRKVKNSHLKTRDDYDDDRRIKKKGATKVKGAKLSSPPLRPTFDSQSNEAQLTPVPKAAPTTTFNSLSKDVAPRQAGDGTCQLNENGFYGTTDVIGDVYTVQYLYQTTVVAGTTLTDLGNFVIQDLDNAITTALLPSFFDCTPVRRRHLQGGTVLTISSTPTDTFIINGLTCAKTLPNTDCYVVQGYSTVIATGYGDLAEIESVFKLAVQVALQGNAILNDDINTSIILDVSALSDTLETVPPVDPTQVAPIPTPITSTAPALVVPSPFPVDSGTDITFAPIPVLPTRPIIEATEPPTAVPDLMPVAAPISSPVVAAPVSPTLSPVAAPVIVVPSQAPVTNTLPTMVASPTGAQTSRDEPSSGSDGLEWWAWLLIVLGGGLLVLCCLSVMRGNRGTRTTPTSGNNKENEDDNDFRDRQDTDPEDQPYEPPPALSNISTGPVYIPPKMGTFSITPPDEDTVPKAVTPPTPPQPIVPPVQPPTVDPPPVDAFVNDDDFIDEEEEEEEEEEIPHEESYSEEVDEDDGVIYDDEVEEEEEEEEEEEVEGEAFDEDESFYEEEELFEHEPQRNETWASAQQSYDSRF